MNEKFNEWKESTKAKWNDFKIKVKVAKDNIIIWANNNPEEAASALLGAASLTAAGTIQVAKHVARKSEEKKEQNERECRVWDPELGLYWYIKKPMSRGQKLEYSRRVQLGENRGDVLSQMRLL